MRTVPRAHRQRGRGRRRSVRPVGRAAPRRAGTPGHRGGTRTPSRAGGSDAPMCPVTASTPAHRSDHARHHRRNLRRRRGIHRRPARAAARRSRLPRDLRRRRAILDVHSDAHCDGRRDRTVRRSRRGARATLRLREWLTRLLSGPSSTGSSAVELRFTAVAADPAKLAKLAAHRRVPALGTDGAPLHHRRTTAAGVHLPGPLCRRAAANVRWPPTPSSPTWTRVSGVYFPAAGCARCPTRWPPQRLTPASSSGYDANGSPSWRARGSRVTAVRTDTGERFPADAVILTTELPRHLPAARAHSRRVTRLRPAPSAVVAHIGCRAAAPDGGASHHTILFGNEWDRTFDEIIDQAGRWSIRRCWSPALTAGDPTLAPHGRDLLYVARAGPQHRCGRQGLGQPTATSTPRRCWTSSPSRLPQLGEDAEILHVVTPPDWARQGMIAGHPVLVLAHLRPDRPVPPGQHGARYRQRRAGGAPPPCPAWASRPPSCPAAWPPTGSPGRITTRVQTGDSIWGHAHDPLRTGRGRRAGRAACGRAYQRCRALNAAHGKTFFLATRLLSPRQRPAVHALYGFARRADDVLDGFDDRRTTAAGRRTAGAGRCAAQPAGAEPAGG